MSHLESVLRGAICSPKVLLGAVLCFSLMFTIELSLSGYSQGQNVPGIQGAVTNSKSMSVDAAKAEAFLEARPVIDMSEFPKVDPHYFENREAIKSRRDRVGNHIYTKFESGLYSVSTVCENRVFYYRQNGELQMVEEETSPSYYNSSCKTTFPKKS
ncbi:MAG: hypothetical protein K2X66_09600, partial [Cyanobacteria bacterium]|nr:hypothetical protein [Cyanobacteriota bacterium]